MLGFDKSNMPGIAQAFNKNMAVFVIKYSIIDYLQEKAGVPNP